MTLMKNIYYSQFGEDKFLYNIFEKKSEGLCVEVGAHNGIDDSPSLFFETIGWQCLLVEPNPHLCKMIRQKRRSRLFECAASDKNGTSILHIVEGGDRSDGLSTIAMNEENLVRIKQHKFTTSPVTVNTMTLDRVLTEAKINKKIDFISIDVEGHEYEVLKGFSIEKWRPEIMLVENNSNKKDYPVRIYLKKYGYIKFARTGVNDWYAHQTNQRLISFQSKSRITILYFMTRVFNFCLHWPQKTRNMLGRILKFLTNPMCKFSKRK